MSKDWPSTGLDPPGLEALDHTAFPWHGERTPIRGGKFKLLNGASTIDISEKRRGPLADMIAVAAGQRRTTVGVIELSIMRRSSMRLTIGLPNSCRKPSKSLHLRHFTDLACTLLRYGENPGGIRCSHIAKATSGRWPG
jgi:hypothetical protein